MTNITQKIMEVLDKNSDRNLSMADITRLTNEDTRLVNETLFELARDEKINVLHLKGKKLYHKRL